jgi:hypothetical protein
MDEIGEPNTMEEFRTAYTNWSEKLTEKTEINGRIQMKRI